jgi:hypothetical protein
MAGVQEENRRKTAFILAAVGIGLIVFGFVLTLNHQSELESSQAAAQHLAANVKAGTLARVLKHVLFFLVILVGIFSISVFAFLRWSRNFRRSLMRRPHPPTPADDVWAMHKLPPELEEPSDSQET